MYVVCIDVAGGFIVTYIQTLSVTALSGASVCRVLFGGYHKCRSYYLHIFATYGIFFPSMICFCLGMIVSNKVIESTIFCDIANPRPWLYWYQRDPSIVIVK